MFVILDEYQSLHVDVLGLVIQIQFHTLFSTQGLLILFIIQYRSLLNIQNRPFDLLQLILQKFLEFPGHVLWDLHGFRTNFPFLELDFVIQLLNVCIGVLVFIPSSNIWLFKIFFFCKELFLEVKDGLHYFPILLIERLPNSLLDFIFRFVANLDCYVLFVV